MATRVLRQPNGLLCLFSTVTDKTFAYDSRPVDIIDDLTAFMNYEQAVESLRRGLADSPTNRRTDDPDDGLRRWREAWETIEGVHEGTTLRAEAEAAMSPNPSGWRAPWPPDPSMQERWAPFSDTDEGPPPWAPEPGRVRWFGPTWGARICDPLYETRVPTECCLTCEQPFEGCKTQGVSLVGPSNRVCFHVRCFVQSILGDSGEKATP